MRRPARAKKARPGRVAGLFRADGEAELALVFDQAPPEFGRTPPGGYREWHRAVQRAYRAQASRIVDALYEHVPGGLVDALLAELCDRRASILRCGFGGLARKARS